MPEHQKIWDQWKDKYYLELLDKGLNSILETSKPFCKMNEEDMNNWLRAQDFTTVPTQIFKVKPPDNHTFSLRKQTGQIETIILRLSLENNATLTGTAEILEEFKKGVARSRWKIKEACRQDSRKSS